MTILSKIFTVESRRPKPPKHLVNAILCGCTILAAILLHLFWFSYFWSQDLSRLVIANGACIVVCMLAFLFGRQGNFTLASGVFTVEMVLYNFYATINVGWDTGCQWFILVVLLPHFLYLESTVSKRNWMTMLCLGFLLSGYFISHAIEGPLGEQEFVVLRFLNTLFVFFLPLLQILVYQTITLAAYLPKKRPKLTVVK